MGDIGLTIEQALGGRAGDKPSTKTLREIHAYLDRVAEAASKEAKQAVFTELTTVRNASTHPPTHPPTHPFL